MVILRQAPLSELLPAAQELLRQHEAASHTRGRPALRLQEATLKAIDAHGNLTLVGAFDGEKLVGYCGLCIIPDGCVHEQPVASVLGIFVTQSYQGMGLGRRLIRAANAAAKDAGATMVQWWVPLDGPLGGLLELEGGEAQEQLYEVKL